MKLALLVCVMLACFSSVSAKGGIGGRPASPLDPDHKGWFVYQLKPGESYQDEILVLNTTDEDWEIDIYPADALENNKGFALKQKVEPMEKIGNWIVLSEKKFLLRAGEKKIVPFEIRIPMQVKNPEAKGGIMIEKVKPENTNQEPLARGSGIRISTRSGVRVYNTLVGRLEEKTTIYDEIAMVPSSSPTVVVNTENNPIVDPQKESPRLLAQAETENKREGIPSLASVLKADLLAPKKEEQKKEASKVVVSAQENVAQVADVSPLKADLLSQSVQKRGAVKKIQEEQERQELVQKIEDEAIAFLNMVQEEKAKREERKFVIKEEEGKVSWGELAKRQEQKEKKEIVFVNSLKADLLTKKNIVQPKKETYLEIPNWASAEQDLVEEYKTYRAEGGQTEFDYWVDHIRQTPPDETETLLGKFFSPWGKRFLYNVFH